MSRSAGVFNRTEGKIENLSEEMTSGTGWITRDELLKVQKSGQFPDDPVKIKDTQIHNVNTQTY
jgi:hypothetical protein